MKRKLPSHIGGTLKQWRALKRREWRVVVKAIERFNLGCAYTPVHTNWKSFEDLRRRVKDIEEQLKGNWTP